MAAENEMLLNYQFLTPRTDASDRYMEEKLMESDAFEDKINVHDFVFRTVNVNDLPNLKDLQKSLFPVEYTDAFYSRVRMRLNVMTCSYSSN
jgi:hypothetical protein